MLSTKRLAIGLIATGALCLVISTAQEIGAIISITLLPASTEVLIYSVVVIAGSIMIAAGCYMVGRMKAKNQSSRLSIDFTKSTESQSQKRL